MARTTIPREPRTDTTMRGQTMPRVGALAPKYCKPNSGDYSRTSLAHLAHETVRGLAHLLIHRTRLPSKSLILSNPVESDVG